MRGLILFAALALPATALAAPPLRLGGAKPDGWHGAPCRSPMLNKADRTDDKADIRKLGDLPSGSLYLSVVRDVNGCREPAIIRSDYGANGDKHRSNGRIRHPK